MPARGPLTPLAGTLLTGPISSSPASRIAQRTPARPTPGHGFAAFLLAVLA